MQEEYTREEDKQIKEAKDKTFGALPKNGAEEAAAKRKQEIRDTHERGQDALRQADKAAHRGDLASAKKWTDVANQMIATQRRLEDMPPPADDVEAEEELRAELRRRVARFVAMDEGMTRWNMRREIWREMVEEAVRNNTPLPPPLPPRPPHWSDELSPDLQERLLTAGAEAEQGETQPPPLEGRGQGVG